MAFNPSDTSWTRPAQTGAVVSAGASALAGGVTRGVMISEAGTLTVTFQDGTSMVFTGLAIGVIHPLAVTHITAYSGGGSIHVLY